MVISGVGMWFVRIPLAYFLKEYGKKMEESMKILYLLFFLFLTSAVSFAYDKDSGCVKCHADKEMLTKLGYPQMYLDPEKWIKR